jgi:hypothetical protein
MEAKARLIEARGDSYHGIARRLSRRSTITESRQSSPSPVDEKLDQTAGEAEVLLEELAV